MSCIHVAHDNLPLPQPAKWVPTGRVEVVKIQGSGPEQFTTWTWFYCSHCGAPGFKRGASEVVYTWGPQDMGVVA